MSKIVQMQVKSFFSNSSQVIYMLLFSFMIACSFSLMKQNARLMLTLFIPAFCAPQLAPKLFVNEKENNTLESLLTLPISLKEIIIGKSLFCFLVISVLLYSSLTISILTDLITKVGVASDLLSLRKIAALYLLPLFMFYNLSLQLSFLSLKSSDSKACSMNATLLGFLYVAPCFIEVVCIDQSMLVWGIISIVYLIVEFILWLILSRKSLRYNKKYVISNLLVG